MKLLLSLLILISVSSFGQNEPGSLVFVDSITRQNTADIEHVKLNMGKFHTVHRNGLFVTATGMAIVTTCTIAELQRRNVPRPVMYLGYVTMMVGCTVTLGSYKYLKIASL